MVANVKASIAENAEVVRISFYAKVVECIGNLRAYHVQTCHWLQEDYFLLLLIIHGELVRRELTLESGVGLKLHVTQLGHHVVKEHLSHVLATMDVGRHTLRVVSESNKQQAICV